jgi:hypothetical protein
LNITMATAIVAERSQRPIWFEFDSQTRNLDVSRGDPLISFGKSVELDSSISDADFFAGIEWDASAPVKIHRAAVAGDLEGLYQFLFESAGGSASRKSARNLAIHPRQSLWSRHQLAESPRAATLIRVFVPNANLSGARKNGSSRGDREPFDRMVVASLDRWAKLCLNGEPLSQLETLVVFEMLRDAGAKMPASVFGAFWRIALTAAIQQTPSTRLANRILDADFCWQAGLLFKHVAGAETVATAARGKLGQMLVESTDSDGIPSAELVEDLPNWLATMLRAREWGERFSRPLFDNQSGRRFQALIAAASRMCLGDGRLAFSNGQSNGITGLWSTAATAISRRNESSQHVVRFLDALGNGVHAPRGSSDSKRVVSRNSVRPVFQSDRSRTACLRGDWSPNANSLSVLHHGRFPNVELATRGALLFSGQWEVELQVANESVGICGPWTCSCWYSDDEADYLELQARPATHVRIERQLLLPRNDDLLFMADVVVGRGDERIDYRSRLPLARDIEVVHDRETRACRLSGPDMLSRLFPIGFPCERVHGCAGQMTNAANYLEFRQTAIGGIYAPIVIDWNPARRRRPAMWRSLTVAQNGTAVPSNQAAGFRLQLGKEQWLIYRSLSRILEPRTVLGQHTMYETLIGRFSTTGAVDPIVLVEQGTEETG